MAELFPHNEILASGTIHELGYDAEALLQAAKFCLHTAGEDAPSAYNAWGTILAGHPEIGKLDPLSLLAYFREEPVATVS